MKNSIFAILACLILSCGVFAQGTYLENQKISAIISTIPQDLNTWSGEIKGTSDVDKAQVLQQIYNLYVTAHDGYSEYGSKAFSSGQNYKNIIDSLTPALLDPENNEDIRNPLDVYITLTAIYLYSYETSQSVQSNIKNKDVIVPDKTVLLMSDRLRDMGSYIEEKLNRYTAESFDDMLRDDIKKKHLVKTKEATYSKAYIAERDSLIARFNDSKQKIDDKSAELMKKFNSELMTQSTTDRTAALTSAKNSKDAEDKYNRINEAKKRTKDLFNKITNQYNNTQIALDNGLEKVNAAKTEYEQIKASNQQEDIETYKKNYEDALKKYNNTQQQLDNLKNRLKEITADLDTINANLNPVQEDFGKKKVIELDKRQMNTNATKQNFNDEEDIKNDLKDLKVNYDGNSPSFSVRIIGIHGSTIKWKANDNRIININNNIGIATVTRPTDANTDIIL
ncbi:MAG: hypothetical protein NTY22_04460, partial [Proteobacteria bacterium]|nr:hypothetical protein [Pseudomonadota bacterium]